MTIGVPTPVRSRFDQLKVRPHRVLSVDFRRGLVDAITGQVFSFTRSVAGAALDMYGTSYTVPVGRPALSVVDGNTGLLRTPDDGLYYPISSRLVEMSGIVQLIDQGGLDDSGTVLARIGIDEPGWRLEVGTARKVQAILSNNASADSTAASATNIANVGEVLYVWWGIAFAGSNMQAQLMTKVEGGAWSSLVEGSEISKDQATWDLEGAEDFARYYVTQVEP